MPNTAAEQFLTKRPAYFVGVKRDGLPWHRLAQVSSLELALDFIHNDAISQGHWATDSLEPRGANVWVTRAAEDTYDIWCTSG